MIDDFFMPIYGCYIDFSKLAVLKCDDCPFDENAEEQCAFCTIGAYDVEEVDDELGD